MLLKKLLKESCPLIMPDAYDALSARLIEAAGFQAVQCSGHSMSIAVGLDREDCLDLNRNLQITRDICDSVQIPVMADGEDGYGPPGTVATTVEAFIRAGAVGINLEDQLLRKDQAGVIDGALMEEKLTAARETACRLGNHDFVINGRIDALAASADREKGLKEAVARGRRYLDAGADLIFVSNVITLKEAERIVKEIPGPVSIAAGLPYNLQKMPLPDLIAVGPARISLPTVAVSSAARGIRESLAVLMSKKSLQALHLDEI